MKTLYLHIGAHRTGTTYLQTCLHRNRDALVDHGIDPLADFSVWGQGHHNVAFSYLGWALRDVCWSREEFLKRFRNRIRDSKLTSIVISSEFFELFDDSAVGRLRSDLAGYRKVVIYWVRNQAQYLESYYRESFKQGLTEPFDSWMNQRVAAGMGDFHAVARRWVAGLDADAIHIVIYENLLRENCNIFGYFADRILGVPISALEFPVEAIINPSADGRFLWLLREMNLRYGRSESHVAGIGTQYLRMRRRLEHIFYSNPSFASGAGPAQIIDASVAHDIAARFEASNARLVADFGGAICNPTSDATLFPATNFNSVDAHIGIESGRTATPMLLELLFRALTDVGETPESSATPAQTPPNGFSGPD